MGIGNTSNTIFEYPISGSKSMGRDPNKGREGSKNESRRDDPNLGCIFSLLPLLVCVVL